MPDVPIRPAKRGDAAAVAILADIAGYGLPAWIWTNSPKRGAGESVPALGRRHFLSDDGNLSLRNTYIAEVDGDVAGMLLGYRQPEAPGPVDDTVPELIRPLLALEALAPGSWYVNVLAVFEEYRGQGIGAALLAKAEGLAAETSARTMSIIVEDDNDGAMALYERTGYERVASRPYVSCPGSAPASAWILLVKDVPR